MLWSWPYPPLLSNRYHWNNDDCQEGKRENYHDCSVQYCVQQLCTLHLNKPNSWLDLALLWLYSVLQFITRQRSYSFAKYWKHFMTHLNGVHAFGYASDGSEWIWMKLGALLVYCLELVLADFGRDPCRSKSGRASWNFCFFGPVNNAQLYRFPVSQISRNSHTRCGSVSPWVL